ncbi:formyltransferase family protein [Cytophagaceae bacterium ABcell3]|nr:formyltransferase family protein [Cytophagaceae bacterium ABcell3]
MNITIFSSHSLSLPLINHISDRRFLRGILTVDENNAHTSSLEKTASAKNISFIKSDRQGLEIKVAQWLMEQNSDLVIVINFPYLIPENLLKIPKLGFYNFHFGLLPAYKGADPVFWQLKNGEKTGGISVLAINENLDSGPVFYQKPFSFFPGENYGLHVMRLGFLSIEVFNDVYEKISSGNFSYTLEHDNTASLKRPSSRDLEINWEENTADEIENLVNACNPAFGGANTYISTIPVKILEVSPADFTEAPEVAPGTIIVHEQQVFAACVGKKFLRVNIIQLPEGTISGQKWALLGAQTGVKFTNNQSMALS